MLPVKHPWLLMLLLLLAAPRAAAAAAELQPATDAAYEAYIEALEQRFAPELQGSLSIGHAPAETLQQLRSGEILSWPGREDGILDVPGGLIHHWRAAVFIPGASLQRVLAVARDYPSYAGIYAWVIGSDLVGYEPLREHRADRYRVRLRIKRSARMVTSVVDVWSVVEYRYPAPDRAVGASRSECIREIENEGRPGERRLPIGRGKGYLWRANTYATYLERDDGVYVDLQNVGLSRGFPPLLGWVVEPIARRLGRGSATETLKTLREQVARREPASAGADATRAAAPASTDWCGN